MRVVDKIEDWNRVRRRNLNGTKTLSKVNGMQSEWRKTHGAESSGTNRTISRSKTKIDKCLTRSESLDESRVKKKDRRRKLHRKWNLYANWRVKIQRRRRYKLGP